MLTSLPGGVWGFLIFINLFIFFLAFFLDFFEIAFIILPMVAPIAQKVLAPVVGADAALIWFGVMLCVNMQTSFLHPPFGFALFYLRGVAPKEVKSSDIYWGAVPWIGLQVIMVVIVIAFPVDRDRPARQADHRPRTSARSGSSIPEIELPPHRFRQAGKTAIAVSGDHLGRTVEPPDAAQRPLGQYSPSISTNFQLTAAPRAGMVRSLHASWADKPLCPTGAVKTAEAQPGRVIVAIALETEPWNRRVHADGRASVWHG